MKDFEQRLPKLTSRKRRNINSRTHMYLFMKALCVVFGFARNRWLNTLYGIVWETKYGRFTTLNIPKCEHFTLLSCLSIAASGDFCHETARKCTKFQNIHVSLLSFLPWTRPRLSGLPHLETLTWQIVTPGDRVTLPGRPGNPPGRVTHLSCKRDQDNIRNYMDRRVTPPRFPTYLGSSTSM